MGIHSILAGRWRTWPYLQGCVFWVMARTSVWLPWGLPWPRNTIRWDS